MKSVPQVVQEESSFLARFCAAFIEAGWLAALVISAFFMNIYTHRMFEPDKACVIRSIAILMGVCCFIKYIENRKKTGLTENSSPVLSSTKSSLWWKHPILLSAIVFYSSYLISCIFSIKPGTSFWGSYDRMQGLYTTTAYFVIFLIGATHIKSKAQVERVISTVIFISIPIVAYGVIQKAGYDPVPWKGLDPRGRIASTMGNPIFLSAFLIMVVPLTLGRLFSLINQLKTTPSGEILNQVQKINPSGDFIRWIKISFYIFLLIIQTLAVILSESRGPLLGLTAGVGFFFIIYALREKKYLILKWSTCILIAGGLWFVIFNCEDTPLLSLKKVPLLKDFVEYCSSTHKVFRQKLYTIPVVSRFARVNPRESSARVRIILWENAIKLMHDNIRPTPEVPTYQSSSLGRFFIGYGPECLGTAFYRYHSAELIEKEGSPTSHGDNCHNSIFNSWLSQGVLGLFSYLFLIITSIYLGIKGIFHPSTNESQKPNGNPLGKQEKSSFLVLLALTSAIVAHFVEAQFGLKIVVTYTHFWIFLAVLYATLNKPMVSFVPLENTRRVLPNNFARKKEKKREKVPLNLPEEARPNFKGFFFPALFWTYVGVTFVLIIIVVKEYWPNLGTNVVGWIKGIYLWILLGIILGTISLMSRQRQRLPTVPKIPFSRLGSFNLLGYALLVILAVFLIIYSNLNLVIADGFYKFSFSADNEVEQKIIPELSQVQFQRASLIQKQKMGEPLSSQEKQQLQRLTARMQKLLTDALEYRQRAIFYFQKCLKLAPNEKTYLNGMGRNFMELGKIFGILQDYLPEVKELNTSLGISVKVQFDPIKYQTPPPFEEILNLSPREFFQFSQYDYIMACHTVIEKAFRLEPYNYERALAMAHVYRFWATILRVRNKPYEDKFNQAVEFYNLAIALSPENPVPREHLVKMYQEFGW